VQTLPGQRAVVRNGYLPDREGTEAAGPIPVTVPNVRGRSGVGAKFRILADPRYIY